MPEIFLVIMVLGILIIGIGLLGARFDATESAVWVFGSIMTGVSCLGYIGYYIQKWIAGLHV